MLKQRILTAVTLIPILFFILFSNNIWLLSALLALILLACSWEWSRLIPLKQAVLKITYIILIIAAFGLCYRLYTYWFMAGAFLWILNVMAVLYYPESQALWGRRVVIAIMGLLILPLFAVSLMRLYLLPHGLYLLLGLLFLIWAADIGAYFAGKAFGRHKLIPRVSPGKSWEGVLGGFTLSLLVAFAGYQWFGAKHLVSWCLFSALIVAISIFGDLFISILKRRLGLKDTSALLPGHGGALDRLDSLIAALPFYYWGITYLLIGT